MAMLIATFAIPAIAEGYRTSVGVEPDAIPIAVVTGTPYEMGLALGQLMKDEISVLMPAYLAAAQLEDPDRFSDAALDAAWKSVSPYVSERMVDEMRGLAEGAGLPHDLVRRVQMTPVQADYSCSGVAVWGDATRNDHLYQIRNLDFSTDAGLQEFPLVVIYLPKDGIAHVNPGFSGVVGSHTGLNAEGIALTEIGDTPKSDYPFDLNGAPFMMMFRDILYSAHNLDEAVNMVKDAKRIKKYHYVIGDGRSKRAVKMKAHAPDLEIWADNDPKDELAPKILKNIVYHAEGRDPIAFAHLSRYQRKTYTADSMIQLSKSIGTLGGNLMNVVYDATSLELWVAYAEKDECAYRRPYVHINVKDYMPYDPKKEGLKVIKVAPSQP